MLSLRPRNQDVARHAEIAAVEFLSPCNVLRGLALQPLVQVAAIVQPCHIAQLFIRMRVQVGALAAERISQQHLRSQPPRSDPPFLKPFDPLYKHRSNVSSSLFSSP